MRPGPAPPSLQCHCTVRPGPAPASSQCYYTMRPGPEPASSQCHCAVSPGPTPASSQCYYVVSPGSAPASSQCHCTIRSRPAPASSRCHCAVRPEPALASSVSLRRPSGAAAFCGSIVSGIVSPLGAPSSARLWAAARPADVLKCPCLCGVGFPRDGHLRQPGAPCTREAHTCQPSAAALGALVYSPKVPSRHVVLRTGPQRPGTHSLSAERGASDRQSSPFGNQLRSGRAILLSLFGLKAQGWRRKGWLGS